MDSVTDIDLESDLRNLPDTKERYVCWVDVMGTAAVASRSVPEASVKVFKLHTAAIAAQESLSDWKQDKITMYPMMDGIYAVSSNKGALMGLLKTIFAALGEDVVEAEETHHILAVRAAISYGPVLAGKDMDGYNDILEGTNHQTRTLIGIPVVQAYLSEDSAPPFGVYVHESARAFAPDGDEPFRFVWWKWFRSNDDEYNENDLAQNVREKLSSYYQWSRKNSNRIGYNTDDIDRHERLAEQYLPAPQDEDSS